MLWVQKIGQYRWLKDYDCFSHLLSHSRMRRSMHVSHPQRTLAKSTHTISRRKQQRMNLPACFEPQAGSQCFWGWWSWERSFWSSLTGEVEQVGKHTPGTLTAHRQQTNSLPGFSAKLFSFILIGECLNPSLWLGIALVWLALAGFAYTSDWGQGIETGLHLIGIPHWRLEWTHQCMLIVPTWWNEGEQILGSLPQWALSSVQKCLIHRVKENTVIGDSTGQFLVLTAKVQLKSESRVLCTGGSRGWRSLAGYSPWGRAESDTGSARTCSHTPLWSLQAHASSHLHRQHKHHRSMNTKPEKHLWVCLRPKLSGRTSLDYNFVFMLICYLFHDLWMSPTL